MSNYSNICAHSELWLTGCSYSLGSNVRTPMHTGWIYITGPEPNPVRADHKAPVENNHLVATPSLKVGLLQQECVRH